MPSENDVLCRIDELFDDLQFGFDPKAEERSLARGVGQRRSRAEGYIATLDLSKPEDRERLFEAITAKIHDWGDDPQWNRLTRLHRTLKAAGYEWNGSQVVPRKKPQRPAEEIAASPADATRACIRPTSSPGRSVPTESARRPSGKRTTKRSAGQRSASPSTDGATHRR
jgi:hypothetical protein